MQNTLINYIRNKKGEPRGVVVAVKDKDEVVYGYSLCNPVDRWNKQQGVKIAIARALSDGYNLPEASNSAKMVVEKFEHLSDRALKYFKDLPIDKVKFNKVEMLCMEQN